MNVSRLCRKAPGSWESYKSKVGTREIYPYVQIKNSFQYSPLCWLPAQRWRVTASLPVQKSRLGSYKHIHLQFWACPCSVWCPDTLPMFYLHSDSVFLIDHRPRRFQEVLMISSPWGNWLSSIQCRITLGNASFETQAQRSVLNQALPLHICTAAMRTFHPKLISQSSYWREARGGKLGNATLLLLLLKALTLVWLIMTPGFEWSWHCMRSPLHGFSLKQMLSTFFSLAIQDTWCEINTQHTFQKAHPEFHLFSTLGFSTTSPLKKMGHNIKKGTRMALL